MLELCELLGVPRPGSLPGEHPVSEQCSPHRAQARGCADVFGLSIHSQLDRHPSETLSVRLDQLEQIDQPGKQQLLRSRWTEVASVRPLATKRDIAEAAAERFAPRHRRSGR